MVGIGVTIGDVTFTVTVAVSQLVVGVPVWSFSQMR